MRRRAHGGGFNPTRCILEPRRGPGQRHRRMRAPSSADDAGPHGAEIESGSVITITDGNVHKGYPASAIVERTADGVVVTLNGHRRNFSRAAIVSNGGSYHIYAPVSH